MGKALVLFMNTGQTVNTARGERSFSFERSATFPPQADHVLVDLFSSLVAEDALRVEPPDNTTPLQEGKQPN